MNINPELVQDVCRSVVNQSATALRAQRVTERQSSLTEPEMLTVDQAELHDLNQLVFTVVEDALPLCQALNVQVLMDLDPRVPAVPMLVRPIQDALAAALDLCLEGELELLQVRTQVLRNRAVVTLQHCSKGSQYRDWNMERFSGWPCAPDWSSASSLDPVELIIGDRTTRALGGRLLLQRRGGKIRLWLELPTNERPYQGWWEDPRPPIRRPIDEYSYHHPGMDRMPIIGSIWTS